MTDNADLVLEMSQRISEHLFSMADEYPDSRVVAGALVMTTTKFLACMSVAMEVRPNPDEIGIMLKEAYLDSLLDLTSTQENTH